MATYLILGDIHGCFFELLALLREAGWTTSIMYEPYYRTEMVDQLTQYQEEPGAFFIAVGGVTYRIKRPKNHPEEVIVSLGDLIDRGPQSAFVLEFFMELVELGLAVVVNSNHDDKLRRHLMGRPVRMTHGLEETMSELDSRGEEFKNRVFSFLGCLDHKYIPPDESFVGVHAAYKPHDNPKKEKETALYGWVNRSAGYEPEDYPNQMIDWFCRYKGEAPVFFGHIVHFGPTCYKTVNSFAMALDTGGVFGGQLTAMRMPGQELFQVDCPIYYERTREYKGPVYLSPEEVFGEKDQGNN